MPKEDSVSIAVVIIRDEQGRYLFVQEAKAAAYGLWGPPGGHVERSETIQAGAIREVLEEVNFKVELINDEPIYESFLDDENCFYRAFMARVSGGELLLQEDEILSAKWYTLEQLNKLSEEGKMRSKHGIQAVMKAEDAYPRH
jgi:8-oxo-dGTP diphosphatase